MPPNYSRHYADVSAMANTSELAGAIADTELRQRVVDWKSKFFARSWARYDLAKPDTFRLVPPKERLAELAGDYRQMREMFLDEPSTFDRLMNALSELEKESTNRDGCEIKLVVYPRRIAGVVGNRD